MIQIENLSKKFGNQQVLKNIELSFQKGKVYGIVGVNGAGKTTFFRCLTTLEDYQGKISYSEGKLKDKLGFLFTNPYFLDKLTGREYLQFVCNARKVESRNFDKNNIFNLPLDKYASSYSTGMKKKLALMGILMQENDVFILDEPFNGVDIQSNLIITEIIQQLKELNKIVLLSSHIFSTLKNTCDELILLEKGTISKKIQKEAFDSLEEEMKQQSISGIIEKLEIR